MNNLIALISFAIASPGFLLAQHCDATLVGSVANFTQFPPAYLSVSGTFTPVLAEDANCESECVFKWHVTMAIRSSGAGYGPDLLLCAGNHPLALTCGKFFWPGSVDGSGDYVQSMDENFSFNVDCGLSLIFELDAVQLLGNLNLFAATMTCGLCGD